MTLLTAFVVASFAATALACNGYEVRYLKVRTCDESSNSIVKFDDNFSADLKDDCTVVVKGCFTVKKQINWGNGNYTVEKKASIPPIKFKEEKLSLCKMLEDSKRSPDVSMVFKMMNLEQKCPLKAGKLCGNPKGVSVAKFKNHMKLLQGEYEGTIQGTGNAGDLCIKIALHVASKGGAAMGGFSKPSMPTMG